MSAAAWALYLLAPSDKIIQTIKLFSFDAKAEHDRFSMHQIYSIHLALGPSASTDERVKTIFLEEQTQVSYSSFSWTFLVGTRQAMS